MTAPLSLRARLTPFARALSFTVPAACAALALPTLSHAADPATPPAAEAEASTEVETITVNANPLGRTADQLVQPVEILNGAELVSKRRATLGETLENEPGVATTDFGPGAGRPVIRGQAGPRVQVLENGIASMDASDVSTDHAVTIDPSHAEQVEVLKGPATLLYGSGASAGVVNVTNGRLPRDVVEGVHGEAEGYYGDNAAEKYGTGAVSLGVGSNVFRVDYAGRHVDSYDIPGNSRTDGSGSEDVLANSQSKSHSGALSYGYISGGSSISLSASQFKTKYGLPVEETAFIDLSQDRYDVQGILDKPTDFLESIKLRAGYVDYDHTEFEAPGVAGTMFKNKQGEERLEAVHVPLAGWRGVIGLQNNDRDFSAIGEEAFVPQTKSHQRGLFVVEEYPYSLGKLEVGGRVERDSHSPTGNPDLDFTPVSLSLGSVFNVGADNHFKAYVTRAQRSPVAEELYAFGPHGATETFERGAVDLDKETTNNFEIGFDHHGERLAWQASVYYERLSNYIYLQDVDQGLNADGSGTVAADGQPDRVDDEGAFTTDDGLLLVDYLQADAKFYGVEGQVTYQVLSGPFDLSVRAFGDQVRGKLDGGVNLPRITPARLGVGLDGSRGPFKGSVSYTRVESQDHRSTLESPTSGYDSLTADISYGFRLFTSTESNSELFLRGRNLLDDEARRATSFLKDVAPLPGVSVLAGLRLVF